MKKIIFILTMLVMVGCVKQGTYEKDVTEKVYSMVKFRLARDLVNEFHKDLADNKIQGITMPIAYYDKVEKKAKTKSFSADSKSAKELHELFNKRIIATYRSSDDKLINIEYR